MEPKQSSFIIVLLSSLLIISCLIAGFFAWKTQNLVKELTAYRLQPTSTPAPTPTPDPTADWKTYRSKQQRFSFKLPQQLVINENKNNIEIFLNQESLDRSKTCKPNANEIEPLPCSPYLINILHKAVSRSEYLDGVDYVNKKQGGMGGEPPYKSILGQNLTWVAGQASGIELRPTIRAFAYDTDKMHFIETNTYTLPFWKYSHNLSSTNDDWQTATAQVKWPEIESLTYQILSTFKFIEPEASSTPLPVACTMDAKICPDGSAVGRSGPKCEFAPCPTPKS